MKNKTTVLFAAIITILSFSSVLYTSCKKDPCSGVTCQNGGSCSNGNCSCVTGFTGTHCENRVTTAIQYKNNSYTPINATINGTNYTIPASGSVTVTGSYGATVTGTASTSGHSSSNVVIGGTINWTLSNTFPSEGTYTQNLDVSSAYFFLEIMNPLLEPTNTLYVNYGLTSQTMESVIIPADTNIYGIGYYNAYSNTIIKLYGATSGYQWSGMTFTNAPNQMFFAHY